MPPNTPRPCVGSSNNLHTPPTRCRATEEHRRQSPRRWAVYLRRATLSRYGESATRTRDIDGLVVELAQRRGTASPTELPTLTANGVDGGSRAVRTVAARFCVVDLLHTCGLCATAEREALAALCQWAPHHEHAPDVTYTYLVETLVVLDRCGRVKQGRSVLNAYGAMLPETGTDGDALLHSYVRLRLGDRQQIEHHEDICGMPADAGGAPTKISAPRSCTPSHPATTTARPLPPRSHRKTPRSASPSTRPTLERRRRQWGRITLDLGTFRRPYRPENKVSRP